MFSIKNNSVDIDIRDIVQNIYLSDIQSYVIFKYREELNDMLLYEADSFIDLKIKETEQILVCQGYNIINDIQVRQELHDIESENRNIKLKMLN